MTTPALHEHQTAVTTAQAEALRARLSDVLAAAKALDDNPAGHLVRALMACQMSVRMEQIRDAGAHPSEFATVLEQLTAIPAWARPLTDRSAFTQYVGRAQAVPAAPAPPADVAEQSGQFWSDLWTQYDDVAYFQEAFELLSTRFELNEVPRAWLAGKVCLDSGCGAGRYSVALARMGAEKVYGVDIGRGSLEDARHRAQRAGVSTVEYVHSSVLTLPFPEGMFDFVLSNGVLHHTDDPERGLAEIYRVMKPGAKLWLYLSGVGGYFDAVVDTVRELLATVPRETTEQVMRIAGFSTERRFYFLDIWYPPLWVRYTTQELEQILGRIGFTRLRRLPRDVSRPDYIEVNELIHRKAPFASFWHGVGEERFIAEK